MKRKTMIIFAVVIVALLALIFGIPRVTEHIRQQDLRDEFIAAARECVESDAYFTPQHGEILSFEAREDAPTLIDDSPFEEYYMTFDCKTTKGDLVIRVHKWYDSGWLYKCVIH